MKQIFNMLAAVLVSGVLIACTGLTPPQTVQQTPMQVAKNFCSTAGTTISNLKLLTDLSDADKVKIGQAGNVIDSFCTALGNGTQPDLAALNTTVTQVAIKYLGQSTIPNKDAYEVALIVAQGLVSTYLQNLQVTATAGASQ